MFNPEQQDHSNTILIYHILLVYAQLCERHAETERVCDPTVRYSWLQTDPPTQRNLSPLAPDWQRERERDHQINAISFCHLRWGLI